MTTPNAGGDGARGARAWALAVTSGALFAAAQPATGAWPLAFVALAPLVASFGGARAGRRAALGWAAGTVATLLTTAVAGTTGTVAYFGLSVWEGAAVAVGVGQLLGAGTFALFGVLCGDPARARAGVAVARAAGAWGAIELLRTLPPVGLPWLLLAYGLAPRPELVQAAAWVGVLGVSMWLAGTGAALALALSGTARGGSRAGAAALVVVLGLGAGVHLAAVSAHDRGAGTVHPAEDGTAPPGATRVVLIQAGVDDRARRDPLRTRATTERLVALTRAHAPADLAVWPENAVNAVLPFNERLLADATAPLWDGVGALLLGAPRASAADPARLHTSAILVGRGGRVLGVHDKVRLLPFAEYTPEPLRAVYRMPLEVAAGAAPRVLDAPPLRLGPLVCYEVLFADVAHTLVENGANVMVNLSNDAWWGTTGAVEQHLAAAVYRAIETRRPLLRATNTGITAAIDAQGRVAARLPMNEPGAVRVDVVPGGGATPSGAAGLALPGAGALLAAGLTMAERRRGQATTGRSK